MSGRGDRADLPRVGLEADQPDRDQVSSDQALLISDRVRSVRSGTSKRTKVWVFRECFRYD